MFLLTPYNRAKNTDISPLKALDELMRMDEDFFRPDCGCGFPSSQAKVDADGATIDLEIPGVDPDKVEISVSGNTVSFKGPLPDRFGHDKGEKKEFSRLFEAPFNVDEEHVEAKYKFGILTVRLPKVKTAEARKIAIVQ